MTTVTETPAEYATITYSYEPPLQPPKSGSGWSEELDYPGVRATIFLAAKAGLLRQDLRDLSVRCARLLLTQSWGAHTEDEMQRYTYEIFRAPTLREAERQAREWAQAAYLAVAEVVSAREARLQARERAIAAAHADVSVVRPPPAE